MAALKTVVTSVHGDVVTLEGRIPTHEALTEATRLLRARIALDQQHLEEMNNWSVETARGSRKALTAEEMRKRNGQN